MPSKLLPETTVHELLLGWSGEQVLHKCLGCCSCGRPFPVDVLVHNGHWELNLQQSKKL